MDELIDFKKRFLKNGELVSIPKKDHAAMGRLFL